MATRRPPGGSMEAAERDVPEVDVAARAPDAGTGREGRVHQDHAGPQAGQPVGDRFGVVAGERRVGEQAGEQPGPGFGDLVEMEGAGTVLAERAARHDRQHPGAGRGFEHGVVGADSGGAQGGVGERKRRGELLEAELVLRPAGVRGLEGGEVPQHVEHGGVAFLARARRAAHRPGIALEEEDDRGLGGFVGVLPRPGAGGVGAAEGPGHRRAQRLAVKGTALEEAGEKEETRFMESIGAGAGGAGRRGRRGGIGERRGGRAGTVGLNGVEHRGAPEREAENRDGGRAECARAPPPGSRDERPGRPLRGAEGRSGSRAGPWRGS